MDAADAADESTAPVADGGSSGTNGRSAASPDDRSAGHADERTADRAATADRTDERRALVLNPVSGSQDHVDDVVELAGTHGFDVYTTEEAGDAERLARETAPEADLVAAVGGDGTLNEVVAGIAAADALASTATAVVPAGTGNNFASNVGINSIEQAFDVIEHGRRRRIDLGLANDRPFVNSCVGGVTAEASSQTTPSGKRQLGVLAYVRETFDTIASYDSPTLRVATAADPDGDPARTWEGDALFVLVGNCRRFTAPGNAQANVEDGLLEVTIVEEQRATDIVGNAAVERLFGGDPDHVVRRQTPSLTVESVDGESVEYSLDGEMLEASRLDVETAPASLTIAVGDDYVETPGGFIA